MDSVHATNYYAMSNNLIFEELDEGWYSVGVEGEWNDYAHIE